MITYTDQHLPGTQLFSANVIKCSLFALKLSYTQRRQAFIKKCLNQQRNIHTVTQVSQVKLKVLWFGLGGSSRNKKAGWGGGCGERATQSQQNKRKIKIYLCRIISTLAHCSSHADSLLLLQVILPRKDRQSQRTSPCCRRCRSLDCFSLPSCIMRPEKFKQSGNWR